MALVALHGNLGAAADWAAIPFSTPVTAVDLWTWQESWPGISPAECGARLPDEIGNTDPAPVLLGYSLGGRLALHALAARPDRWQAAIFVSTHPGLADADERRARLVSDRDWADRARHGDWAAFLADWNAQATFAGSIAPPNQSALEARREAIARGFESWSLGCQQPMEAALEAFRRPVLWVTGEQDAKFGGLAARIPRGQRAAMPGCGHRAPWERPEDFAALVEGFLRREGISPAIAPACARQQ